MKDEESDSSQSVRVLGRRELGRFGGHSKETKLAVLIKKRRWLIIGAQLPGRTATSLVKARLDCQKAWDPDRSGIADSGDVVTKDAGERGSARAIYNPLVASRIAWQYKHQEKRRGDQFRSSQLWFLLDHGRCVVRDKDCARPIRRISHFEWLLGEAVFQATKGRSF